MVPSEYRCVLLQPESRASAVDRSECRNETGFLRLRCPRRRNHKIRRIRNSADGWPTQGWFWLEWGSSTARRSSPAALSRFRAIRVDLDPYLTAGCVVAKTAPLAVFEALTCPPPAQRTELRTTPLKPNSGLSGPPTHPEFRVVCEI